MRSGFDYDLRFTIWLMVDGEFVRSEFVNVEWFCLRFGEWFIVNGGIVRGEFVSSVSRRIRGITQSFMVLVYGEW